MFSCSFGCTFKKRAPTIILWLPGYIQNAVHSHTTSAVSCRRSFTFLESTHCGNVRTVAVVLGSIRLAPSPNLRRHAKRAHCYTAWDANFKDDSSVFIAFRTDAHRPGAYDKSMVEGTRIVCRRYELFSLSQQTQQVDYYAVLLWSRTGRSGIAPETRTDHRCIRWSHIRFLMSDKPAYCS